jgi:hypothetical protein
MINPMKELIRILVLGLFALSAHAYTPEPGFPERQAICDAARAFVINHYKIDNRVLPQPIVFRVGHIAVQGAYANLEAFPVFKDSSDTSGYIEDTGYNFCLKKLGRRWDIFLDLRRSDVPDAIEIRQIRSQLPEDFPLSLLSPFWQKLLSQ